METKKYKQVAVDHKTHADLTKMAKATGRTRMGLVRWLLDQHTQVAPARRQASQKEGAAA